MRINLVKSTFLKCIKRVTICIPIHIAKLEDELKNIKGFFKGKQKRILQQEIENCQKDINVAKENLHKIVQQKGYKDVESFLKIYSEARKMIEQWKKEKHTKKESIIEKLKELEGKANLYQQNIEQHRKLER